MEATWEKWFCAEGGDHTHYKPNMVDDVQSAISHKVTKRSQGLDPNSNGNTKR
jgi:hypothetical protein